MSRASVGSIIHNCPRMRSASLGQRVLRRYLPWVLVVVGIGALGAHTQNFERLDGAAWVALLSFAAAPILGLPTRPALRWLLLSIPFWMFGNAVEWMQFVAVGCTIAAFAALAVSPTLVGRRKRAAGVAPLEHLASGPLTPVTPRVFSAAGRSRVLTYMTVGAFVLALLLFVLMAAGVSPNE